MSDRDLNDLGVEWFDVESSKRKARLQSFVSAPYTGLSSPTAHGQPFPLIKHEVSAGAPFRKQQKDHQLHQKFIEQKVQTWGPSSAFSVDWNALQSATHSLVDGVIKGDIEKVKRALSNHADPNMTVSVLDPNNATGTKYVVVPLGVAALLRGKEVADQGNNVAGSFKEIATMLLTDGTGPRVSVGNHPQGFGSAIGYHARGMSVDGDNAGADSVEHRVVEIPMFLRTMIGSAVPEAILDGAVADATDGLVWGEEFSASAPKSYLDLVDAQEITVQTKIEEYRHRRARPASIAGPSYS